MMDFAMVFVVTPCPFNRRAKDAWMAAHQSRISVTCPRFVACTCKLALSALPPSIQATTVDTKLVLALSVADPVTRKTL